MVEEWRDIEGYEGYMVSNKGRVKSFRRHKDGVVMKPQTHSGYAKVLLRCGDKVKSARIHRLTAQAFIPNTHNKPHINHKDGIKVNNNINNIEWTTPSDNHKHAYKNGLRTPTIGERAGLSKLTEKQVIEIHKLLANGVRQVDVANMYEVSKGAVHNIKSGRTWKHLDR